MVIRDRIRAAKQVKPELRSQAHYIVRRVLTRVEVITRSIEDLAH